MILSPCQFETATRTEFANGTSQSPPSGGANIALDNNNEMDQAWSLVFTALGAGSGLIDKTSASPGAQINIQFLFKLSADYVLPTAGYLTLLNTYDNSLGEAIYVNLEKGANFTLTLGGDVIPYTATSVILTPDTVHKIEIQIIRHATTGSIKIWIDNDVEASPDYDSGNINTSAGVVDYFSAGVVYTPGAFTGKYFIDNFMADSIFLGDHWLPFRFENIASKAYDSTDKKTVYAERLNQIKMQTEKSQGFLEA